MRYLGFIQEYIECRDAGLRMHNHMEKRPENQLVTWSTQGFIGVSTYILVPSSLCKSWCRMPQIKGEG